MCEAVFQLSRRRAGSNSNAEQLILAANPILEAFGNAKTLRNNNSHDSEKWVAIDFDPYGKIVSAKAQSFLWRKSESSRLAKGERNFHIFYQLFSSRMREVHVDESREVQISWCVRLFRG